MASWRRLIICLCSLLACAGPLAAEDLTLWRPLVAGQSVLQQEAERAVLQGAEWTWLGSATQHADVKFEVTLQVDSAASQFDFFGSGWSAWPDPKFGDRGFEAGLLLRGGADGTSGYRVQLSTKYQECALVRFPDGGYVRSVPCAVPLQRPLRLSVVVSGSVLRVLLDGREVLTYADRLGGMTAAGLLGLGASSGARVTFSGVQVSAAERLHVPEAGPHVLRLSSRRWLGGRQFVFDDNEPILQLHSAGDPAMFAKLRPGLKPLLTFDSHWGLENQGAYREAAAEWTESRVSGGGEALQAEWSARHVQGRFTTSSRLQVGFDQQRQVYTYEIDSELLVLPGEPWVLELANVDWVREGGRRGLRFSENSKERADYPSPGLLDTWLRHPQQRQNYEPHRHGAFGLGGFHGGGRPLKALTLATWIRPAGEMGAGPHPGRGDLIGFGARRFILGLEGQTAPYRLGAWLNVNDRVTSESRLEAERWSHVAMTCESTGERWRVRLYVDGIQVGEGLTEKLLVSETVPDSLILGGEYFYLHCHYYRGLMGPVQVVERCLTESELRVLAEQQ